MVVPWIMALVDLRIGNVRIGKFGMNEIAAFDRGRELNTEKTHNLNHVRMALWALQTMLISKPFILAGVTKYDFSLLSALVGHVVKTYENGLTAL